MVVRTSGFELRSTGQGRAVEQALGQAGGARGRTVVRELPPLKPPRPSPLFSSSPSPSNAAHQVHTYICIQHSAGALLRPLQTSLSTHPPLGAELGLGPLCMARSLHAARSMLHSLHSALAWRSANFHSQVRLGTTQLAACRPKACAWPWP